MESLTRFRHFRDGNILFVRHETQDGEDCEACHEAGAAVEKAQRHAISATEMRFVLLPMMIKDELCKSSTM